VRHVPVPVIEEPGEDEWKIIAAGTVTNPVFRGKEVGQCFREEGVGVPMLQNQTTWGIQNPTKSYVLAVEGRSSLRFARRMT
jgi:hypothetical protein